MQIFYEGQKKIVNQHGYKSTQNALQHLILVSFVIIYYR